MEPQRIQVYGTAFQHGLPSSKPWRPTSKSTQDHLIRKTRQNHPRWCGTSQVPWNPQKNVQTELSDLHQCTRASSTFAAPWVRKFTVTSWVWRREKNWWKLWDFLLEIPNLLKHDMFWICLDTQSPNTSNMRSNWAPGSHWSARVVCWRRSLDLGRWKPTVVVIMVIKTEEGTDSTFHSERISCFNG